MWFGEALPKKALKRVREEFSSADVAFVVGTAGLVYPAASLPYVAKQHGAFVVEVNPEETPITDIADVSFKGHSGAILPIIVERFHKAYGQQNDASGGANC